MPEQSEGQKDMEKQLEESTKQKFSQYEAAIAAGGEESHKIWATFTEKEKQLWRELSWTSKPGSEKPEGETKE